ncbi:ATP-binding protein [Cyclobacterium plantarum]|uniref:AAA family ATPase n=1 Tax=Cyclobacterium plantarum TaxID=2716263 RepID=A0ABX0HAA3_9BACT|nr:AAA family ATPase [Cyclobacterium plantarum]NHE57818.1 AAA family ATPase [Cyclobacterium plantarum]
METLVELHIKLIATLKSTFTRSIYYQIDWGNRLIGIIGARGTGKTTLLLQRIKKKYPRSTEILYVSLDHIWFSNHSLVDLVDGFAKAGGKILFIDEVHKYSNWSVEIKNIYDFYPELKVVFTGSSLLEILNARADLSRRALVYEIQGLSFREYLNLVTGKNLPVITLETILQEHVEYASDISQSVRPLKYFPEYLKTGYYPFFKDFKDLYGVQVLAIINLIIEIELPLMRKVDIAYASKIKQLLSIIADAVPFVPNVSKLSRKIGINRQTLLAYLHYLEESRLTKSIYRKTEGVSLLQKPEKLFLENTNLSFALGKNVDLGNLRETFFLNQLSYIHTVNYPETSDFLVNQSNLFEIGGKDKKINPSENKANYVAADGLEVGFGNKIPLWLFGFLY